MKRLALVAGLLLLAGCGDAEKVVQEEPEAVVSATNEESEVEEAQEVEVRQYTDNEIDEFQFAIMTASEQAAEYLSNMRADIYICGKICDGQPLTDIQLSMNASRSDVERSASALENLVPQIRDVAKSGSENVNAEEMNQIANQFEKTAADMRAFLMKEDWTSWDGPHEMIQTMLDDLEQVTSLYSPPASDTSANEPDTYDVGDATTDEGEPITHVETPDALQGAENVITGLWAIEDEINRISESVYESMDADFLTKEEVIPFIDATREEAERTANMIQNEEVASEMMGVVSHLNDLSEKLDRYEATLDQSNWDLDAYDEVLLIVDSFYDALQDDLPKTKELLSLYGY